MGKNLNCFLINLFFLSVVFSSQPLGGVLAVVGDEIITQGEFFQQLGLLAEQKGINPSLTPKKYEVLADRVLSNMIDQYVFLNFAIKDSNVVVSDLEVKKQVEQQVSYFINQVGSIKELEKIFNLSLREIKEYYWEEVYHSLLIDRFKYSLLSDVSVGKKEVEVFYLNHKDSLPPLPETGDFSLLHLFFDPSIETIDSVYSFCAILKDSVLLDLENFDSFVIKHSDDVSSVASSGVVGYTSRGSLFPEYEEAVFSASPGDLLGPIRTAAGFHIIKVLDKKGEKINSQHLLKIIFPTEKDKKKTVEKINSIYKKSIGDEFYLESYIDNIDYSQNNFSGNYSNYILSNLPDEIYSIIKELGAPSLSSPFVLSNGSILLAYLYNKNNSSKPSLDNAFDYISSLAKDEKAKRVLDDWLIKSKKNVFINIFEQ